MDKISWMFLLLGLIIVVLLSNNYNYLEGFDENKSNVQDEMAQQIQSIDPKLKELGTEMGNDKESETINSFEFTNNKITKLQPLYDELSKNSVAMSNNESTTKMYRLNDNLQYKNYVINNSIKKIDTSLEKIKDSQVIYTKYKYDNALWGIIVVGLMVMTITTFM